MVGTKNGEGPNWLTEKYLEKVLQTYKKDKTLRIEKLVIKPATSKGENYASVMTRVKVIFKQSSSKDLMEESYLVKTTHENDPKVQQVIKHYQPYSTEMLMYEQVLPQLSAILKETGEEDQLYAETIHVDYEHTAIIFEDLSVKKYVMADRILGFDKPHTLLALSKLAKLHASAAVLNERQPDFLTRIDRGIFNKYTKGFHLFFTGVTREAAEFASSCPELGPYYQEKLLKLADKIMDYGAKSYEPKEGFFNTLNHGDFWTNNMMFLYDENNPKLIKDLKMIDFQFCSWSPPAIDLFYFMHTSWQADLKFNQYEALIKYYHDTLVKYLKKLNFQSHIPSLKEFWIELQTSSFIAVPVTLACQALMINTETEDADFNAMMEDNERARRFKRTLYKNPRLQESLKRTLPIFDNRGLLDIDD